MLLWTPLAALSPRLSVRQYQHTAWTEAGGHAMPEMDSIAQTAEGYLWLTTNAGHLRFDGIRVSDWPPFSGAGLPSARPYRVLTARDGATWLVTVAGFSRIFRGEVRSYPQDLERRQISGLVEDNSGRIWTIVEDPRNSVVQALSPNDGAVRRFGVQDGLPLQRFHSIVADGEALWLGFDGGFCRWVPGTPASCWEMAGRFHALARSGDGVIYAASTSAVYRIRAAERPQELLRVQQTLVVPDGLLADRNGNLWVGTSGGVWLLHGERSESFTRKDGLSSDLVRNLIEDAEGDIWVATSLGLDRFRNPRVLHLTSLDGLHGDQPSAVKASRDGSVWVGTNGAGLNRIQGESIRHYSLAEGLASRTITAIQEDGAGRIWTAHGPRLSVMKNGRFEPVELTGENVIVSNLAVDPAGAVWAAGGLLFRVSASSATTVQAGQPGDIFRVLATAGTIWIGSWKEGLMALSSSSHAVGERYGKLGPGPLRQLIQREDGSVWCVAGPNLSRVLGGKVTTWGVAQGLSPEELSGLVFDRAGSLWLVSTAAVLRLPVVDLDKSPDGQPLPIRCKRYDQHDGLRMSDRPGMATPRIEVAADGRVWVCERGGVAVLDPDLLQGNSVRPPVVIEEFTLDRHVLPSPPPPFRGRQLQIAYTANSLMAPERVSFRYRLEPGDGGWTEAEGQREVNFVGLAPGNYVFHVTACNLDGVCNPEGATTSFTVMPYFYQTIWFKFLVALALGGIGWGIYLLRMRQVVARFHLVAQERARVTREIHDSLLQGFAGVVFQLGAASNLFEKNPALSKQRLDRALDQADTSLREARQMLLEMRLPILEDRTLVEALAEVGENAVRNTPVVFSLKVKGADSPLPYAAQAALFLIGREAINNAMNHANPGRVTVTVTSTDKDVRLVVQDDGSGFDLEAGKQKEGHMGLESMEARARQAGASFRMETAPGEGTMLEVVVSRKRR